jgi:hypothetical protein
MWYKFTAYNSETHFGWTQDPRVVEAALESLNRRRDINLYAAECLGDSDDETGYPADDEQMPLKERNDLLFDDDTRPDEFGV